MSAAGTLRLVIGALESAEIPFMLVGSNAAMAHGANRTTVDIDIVIDPTHSTLDKFLAMFEPDEVYIGPSPHEALDLRDQFNLIDSSSGWKVDLVVRKDRHFSRSEFDRRVNGHLMGMDVWVATAEDVVLSKLEWALAGGSDRQVDDATRVLAVQAGDLDEEYLDRWADDLGVRELLERARAAAGGERGK